MADARVASSPRSEPVRPPVATRRWLVAIVAGSLLGPLDLWGQVASPYPWAHLFNSPAVWAAGAFAYGRWARRPVTAALGAVLLLVVAVEAYSLADVLVRDADRANMTSLTTMTWLFAAVVAGVVFGTAGAWSTARTGWIAVLGRAALPAVFGAEAARNVWRVTTEPADGRPDDLGQFAALLGVLGLAALALLVRRTDRRTAGRTITLAIGASAIIGVVAGTIT